MQCPGFELEYLGGDAMKRTFISSILLLFLVFSLVLPETFGQPEPGFVSIFNGRDLEGWMTLRQKNQGYLVRDGILICPKGESAKLFTEREYSNFIFRFEFKLQEGGNNGVALRAPVTGNASFDGMEIQILDNSASKYEKIKPYQTHGSVYGLVPAQRGALNPVTEWNQQEIILLGRRIQITLNGKVIVSANLNKIKDPKLLQAHPGMLRSKGHLGFLGHSTHVEFRNIRIKDLGELQVDNLAPEGFEALFNGMDLTGWKGLVASPRERASMSSGKG